jgi:hypothetical protein
MVAQRTAAGIAAIALNFSLPHNKLFKVFSNSRLCSLLSFNNLATA